jgi:hypothetical protein
VEADAELGALAMSLGDLDELVISCRTAEARTYVAEAVSCYKAGAFRSCIVAAWIAVVYDLLAKIRELALGGDAAAQVITSEVAALQPRVEMGDQVAIRRILYIEREIVDVANDKFGFFDGQQLLDLHRLGADRNRCAHPTYQGVDQPYTPSAELARAHLVHAVRHVLAVPPVQGKAAMAHIVRLVESNLFPTDVDQAKVQLRLGGLERPKDSLVKAVVDQLVFGYFEGAAPLKGQRRTAMAVRAIFELYPGLAEIRLRHTLNNLGRRLPDNDLYLFFGLLLHLPLTWDFLEQDNKTRIEQLLLQTSTATVPRILPTSFSIPDLEAASRERTNALESEELGRLLQATKHPIAIARAVDLYCSSRSFDQANARYSRVIEPVLDQLTEEQIRRILIAARTEGADLHGAHSFNNFAKYIYEHQKIPRPEIIATLRENSMDWIADRIEATPATEDDEIPF